MPRKDYTKRSALGSIYERKPGYWEIRKQCGRKPDGSPRILYDTVRGTEDDARAALYAMSLRMGDVPAEADGMTLQEFFEFYFIPELERRGRANVTIHGYRSTWRAHIVGRWGDVPMAEIREGEVRAWVWTMERPYVARDSFKLLKQILRSAYDYGFLEDEPLRRRIPLPPLSRKPPEVWGPEEVLEALRRLQGSRIEPVVLLMLGGGLRREEALAIRMEDLRFETGVVTDFNTSEERKSVVCWAMVNKAYTKLDGLKPTKNPQSIRMVAIGEPFSSRLEQVMPESGPILMNRYGVLGNPELVSKRWKSYFEPGGRLEGMRWIKLMNLRHTHATLMLASGVDTTTTAKAHGHSEAVEYRHYINPTDGTLEESASKVSDFLNRGAI